MIDLHSHILPGIDDGAKDLEMALEMAQQAVARGIKAVAATPHYLKVTWSEVKNKTNELRLLLTDHGIELEVIAGAELYIDPMFIDLRALIRLLFVSQATLSFTQPC
jgi:protein-tyrosine phosphatase